MVCLNRAAFEILKTEIQRRCADNPVTQVKQEFAVKRLQKLHDRSGQPYTAAQLRETLDDLFPDFDQRTLNRAAKANQPRSPIGNRLTFAAIAIVGVAGGIWVLNLPYPMIRYPVARTIPLILLPSFISMDHNYRQAIANTEQADQLVNRATSSADFELGHTKVEAAKKNLDALPVWFLGYYPGVYCGWFGCTWRFTLDEFEQARKNVARMEARLFQEKNALTKIEAAEQTIAAAKQRYQQQPNAAEKQAALAQWQQAMDELKTISGETLAGKTAQTKLIAFERDFQQMAGFTATNARSGNVMQAAQLAAETAQKFSSKPTQTVTEWQEAAQSWKEAIAKLEIINVNDPDYVQAQKLIQQYKQKLGQTRIRLQQEEESIQAYERAQTLTEQLIASVSSQSKQLTPDQVRQLQTIVNQLEKVSTGTTVYADAQRLLKSAKSRLR